MLVSNSLVLSSLHTLFFSTVIKFPDDRTILTFLSSYLGRCAFLLFLSFLPTLCGQRVFFILLLEFLAIIRLNLISNFEIIQPLTVYEALLLIFCLFLVFSFRPVNHSHLYQKYSRLHNSFDCILLEWKHHPWDPESGMFKWRLHTKHYCPHCLNPDSAPEKAHHGGSTPSGHYSTHEKAHAQLHLQGY